MYRIYYCLLLLALGLSGCGGTISKEEIEATIDDVLDGNTVVLSTGTPVHLCGVDPNSTFTKQYLESHYLGREVYIKIGKDDIPTIDDYDEDFDAFVIVKENNECINRTLLALRHEAFNSYNCIDPDSLKAYAELTNPTGVREPLNEMQLAAKMKAASLLVFTAEEQHVNLGTAFLINSSGLAVTNHHVVKGAQQMVVYLSDSEGNIDESRKFGIIKIVDANEAFDYAFFYVNFDDDTKQHLNPLPLSRLSVSAGEKIAAVGNPAPGDKVLPMRLASGSVSSYNDQDRSRGEIGVNVPITHGFSGGPQCNYFGEVIGISKSGYEHSDANLNYAVDIKKVRERLDDLGIMYEGK